MKSMLLFFFQLYLRSKTRLLSMSTLEFKMAHQLRLHYLGLEFLTTSLFPAFQPLKT
jgi:hypothetical protein